MDLLSQSINFVNESFNYDQWRINHFQKTMDWIEKLIPNFNIGHLIAAYSHDIERAFYDESANMPEDYLDPEFLKRHQQHGAKIICDYLITLNCPQEILQTVKHLVSQHEVGGDFEQNAIMDADSLSWLETVAERFVLERAKKQGYKAIKDKLDWMYNRISTVERKELAKEMYIKWVGELDKIKEEKNEKWKLLKPGKIGIKKHNPKDLRMLANDKE